MNFFDLPLPTDVSVLQHKYLSFTEQRVFGGVSRRCLQLSDTVTRLTTACDMRREIRCTNEQYALSVGMRKVITEGKLPMLRSVTLDAPAVEDIEVLMCHCPQLDTLFIDCWV